MNKNNLFLEQDIPIFDMAEIDVSTDELNKIIKSKALSVFVDDLPAHIFIRQRKGFMSNEKVVIIFEEKNERWPDGFQTKYYMINTPGVLEWGHNGEKMSIVRRT
jgi:hypothetical protein